MCLWLFFGPALVAFTFNGVFTLALMCHHNRLILSNVSLPVRSKKILIAEEL